jgi:hypothetical protein
LKSILTLLLSEIISRVFFTGWGSSPALNFGGKLHGIFAKGEEKT